MKSFGSSEVLQEEITRREKTENTQTALFGVQLVLAKRFVGSQTRRIDIRPQKPVFAQLEFAPSIGPNCIDKSLHGGRLNPPPRPDVLGSNRSRGRGHHLRSPPGDLFCLKPLFQSAAPDRRSRTWNRCRRPSSEAGPRAVRYTRFPSYCLSNTTAPPSRAANASPSDCGIRNSAVSSGSRTSSLSMPSS